MAYTPELFLKLSCTLRRIAWALGISMTQAIKRVFEQRILLPPVQRSIYPLIKPISTTAWRASLLAGLFVFQSP